MLVQFLLWTRFIVFRLLLKFNVVLIAQMSSKILVATLTFTFGSEALAQTWQEVPYKGLGRY